MNENEFEVGGKVYVEIKDDGAWIYGDVGICKGCAGDGNKYLCDKLPDSCASEDVIFVEKQS